MSRIPCATDCKYCKRGHDEEQSPEVIHARGSIALPYQKCRQMEDEVVHLGRTARKRKHKQTEVPLPEVPLLEKDKWVDQLTRSQQEDDLFGILDKWREAGSRPSWNEVSRLGKRVIYWWSRWKQLKKEHGLWWYAWIGDKHRIHWKIIVPETLRGDLLKEHHEGIMSRHCGVEETYQRLVLSPYYWDHMYVSVELHCGSCDLCWQTKDLTKEAYEEASPLEEMGIIPRRFRRLQHLPSV